MGNPGLSYARVERLLIRLPYESRLFKTLLKTPVVWTVENEQLACIFDALNILAWQNENEGRKKHQQTKQPERYPRPADMERKSEEKTRKSEMARRLLEQKERLANGNQE